MRFEKADHYVGSALFAAMQLFKGGKRLAYAWGNSQVDTVSTSRARACLPPDTVKHLVRCGSV
jgi:hypothetical protein